MAALNVSPGDWVRVRIADGVQRARIRIGDAPAVPAFIQNERERGTIATYAQVRCPDLRPGSYRVYATSDGEIAETTIRVV